MVDMPEKPEDLSLGWLQEVLSNSFNDAKITNIKIELSVGDLGYLGTICRVHLEFDKVEQDLPDSIMVKFPPSDESARKDGDQLRAYETEGNFYKHCANNHVGRAPKHYFSVCEPALGKYVLIIEDLKALRFVSQTEGARIADCREVMSALAALHAQHWETSELKAMDWLGDISDWGTSYMPLILKGQPNFDKDFGHLLGPYIKDKWLEGIDAYPKVLKHLQSGPSTLIHGDAHIRNLAFEDGHENPVRFYDWQLTCRGPAAYDVIYFVVNSMTVDEQNLYLEALLELYIGKLTSLGIDYSKSDLHRDMGFCGVTFWGFFGWLGNFLPPNEATLELVESSVSRYQNMMQKFESHEALKSFRP